MHTHSSEHTHRGQTPGAVGSHIAAVPGEQLGDLLKGLASVVVLKVEESAGYLLHNQNCLIIETVLNFGGIKTNCEFLSL